HADISRHHRPIGQLCPRLADYLHALAKLLHAHQEAIVYIAVRAYRHFEIYPVIHGVGHRLADIVGHAGTAQRRPGQTPLYSILGRYDPHTLDPAQEDRVLRQERIVLAEALRQDIHEGFELVAEAWRDVLGEAAHALGVQRQPRPGLHLQHIEDQLPLAHRIQEDGDRPQVHDVRAQPQEM